MCSYPPYLCFPTTVLLQELGQLQKQKGVLFSGSVPWFSLLHKHYPSYKKCSRKKWKGGMRSPFSSSLDSFQVKVSRWWQPHLQQFSNGSCGEFKDESGLLSRSWRILSNRLLLSVSCILEWTRCRIQSNSRERLTVPFSQLQFTCRVVVFNWMMRITAYKQIL